MGSLAYVSDTIECYIECYKPTKVLQSRKYIVVLEPMTVANFL